MLIGYFGLILLHTHNKKKGVASELNLEMEIFLHFSMLNEDHAHKFIILGRKKLTGSLFLRPHVPFSGATQLPFSWLHLSMCVAKLNSRLSLTNLPADKSNIGYVWGHIVTTPNKILEVRNALSWVALVVSSHDSLITFYGSFTFIHGEFNMLMKENCYVCLPHSRVSGDSIILGLVI